MVNVCPAVAMKCPVKPAAAHVTQVILVCDIISMEKSCLALHELQIVKNLVPNSKTFFPIQQTLELPWALVKHEDA